ncbi:hypothetical protein GCM10009784_25500 [Arthrobacter parietis]|uniref:Lipoprotein n=1 Tax=Arthrobacter parietis TaxID=271434 RepID=A0ABN3AZG9_9MICC
MGSKTRKTWAKKAATIAVLPAAVLGVAGCGEQSVYEAGVDLEDPDAGFIAGDEESDNSLDSGPYDEVYDQNFWDELTIYFGEEVTLSAQVKQPLDPRAFTIAGMDDTTVNPLLVVHDGEVPQLEPGQSLIINGTVHEYLDVEAVEEELGVDLDDTVYEQWEDDPYLLATSVKVDAASAP